MSNLIERYKLQNSEFVNYVQKLYNQREELKHANEQQRNIIRDLSETIDLRNKEIDDLQQTLANYQPPKETYVEEHYDRMDTVTLKKALNPYKPKIAIIIGHDALVQGAISPFLNKTEWEFYNAQAVNGIGAGNILFYRNRNGVSSAHDAIRAHPRQFDLVLEFHFNAFSNPQANGAEILMAEYLNKFERTLADHVLQEWCHTFGLRDRGLKFPAKGARGFKNVNGFTDAPTFLLEPFFGTNETDCDKIKNVNIVEWFVNEFAKRLIEQNNEKSNA